MNRQLPVPDPSYRFELLRPQDREPLPPPLPDDDDAKVARRQRQLASQLYADIAAAGEGGWRSPYYTGSVLELPPEHSRAAYLTWKTARDNWTKTGNRRYLQTVREATDFHCPPDAPIPAAVPVTPAVKYTRTFTLSRYLLISIVIYVIGVTIGLLIPLI